MTGWSVPVRVFQSGKQMAIPLGAQRLFTCCPACFGAGEFDWLAVVNGHLHWSRHNECQWCEGTGRVPPTHILTREELAA